MIIRLPVYCKYNITFCVEGRLKDATNGRISTERTRDVDELLLDQVLQDFTEQLLMDGNGTRLVHFLQERGHVHGGTGDGGQEMLNLGFKERSTLTEGSGLARRDHVHVNAARDWIQSVGKDGLLDDSNGLLDVLLLNDV